MQIVAVSSVMGFLAYSSRLAHHQSTRGHSDRLAPNCSKLCGLAASVQIAARRLPQAELPASVSSKAGCVIRSDEMPAFLKVNAPDMIGHELATPGFVLAVACVMRRVSAAQAGQQ
jgi:hypothetical protein